MQSMPGWHTEQYKVCCQATQLWGPCKEVNLKTNGAANSVQSFRCKIAMEGSLYKKNKKLACEDLEHVIQWDCYSSCVLLMLPGEGQRPGGQSFSSGRVKNFLFSRSSTQPPIQWVLGAFSPGVKQPGCEVDHSPPTNAEVKKMWIYTSTPHMPS
jgi:hypothetical protein